MLEMILCIHELHCPPLQVDFDAPVGYQPPDPTHSMETEEQFDTWEEVIESTFTFIQNITYLV